MIKNKKQFCFFKNWKRMHGVVERDKVGLKIEFVNFYQLLPFSFLSNTYIYIYELQEYVEMVFPLYRQYEKKKLNWNQNTRDIHSFLL